MATSLDKMYFLASIGNKEAENELYQMFLNDGIKIAKKIIFSNKFYRLKAEDFADKIAECYLNVISTFSPKDSKFSTYSHFILEKKLTKVILDEMTEAEKTDLSLDDYFEDGHSVIEMIADPNIVPLPSDVSVEIFKQMMSSPKSAIGHDEKKRQKINKLLIEGYTLKEISEITNMSVGKIRGIIRKNQTDENLAKMKLELK